MSHTCVRLLCTQKPLLSLNRARDNWESEIDAKIRCNGERIEMENILRSYMYV